MGWGRFLRCVVLLGLPMAAGAASVPDPRKPLRYPFGLTPDTTAQQIQAVLTSKGLKRDSEKDTGLTLLTTWRMSGQIAYQDFRPAIAILTLDHYKLVSVTFVEKSLPHCGAAQPVYLSALAFVRDNYVIDKKNTLTREPAVDTLDCGPHFKSEDYELQLTGKDFVISVTPVLKDGRYAVDVTYRWAGLLTSDQEKGKSGQTKSGALQENL